ncbi:hypothetical protein PybrP1_000451 [[Pythium] brassicae (nom. inval.)]|nr:hypothetical protein PybrP1_000451 [[Pythium] brassicae (nom. inval.)]
MALDGLRTDARTDVEMKDAAATRDEHFADSYAGSRLKQQYDTVVVDDSRGIGGFLWKFPSEGSNRVASSSSHRMLVFPLASSSVGASPPGAAPSPTRKPVGVEVLSYPRKCDRCESAWFSDRKAERRHRKCCSGARASPTASEKTRRGGGSDSSGDGEDGKILIRSGAEEAQLAAAKLGVARRVWCEVDSSLSQLQVGVRA